MCNVLDVSKAGYYAWRVRKPSAHQRCDAQLELEITSIHRLSRESYGSPRVHRELHARGWRCSRKRVARLMRNLAISVKKPRGYKVCTTDSKHGLPVAENVVDRAFNVSELNRIWVSDITYINTDEGWLFLAVFLDAGSRKAIGWCCKDHLGTDIVLEPLQMALHDRKYPKNVIVHSDRGTQYASRMYRSFLETHGLKCSMSRPGNCYDNAVAESFFASLKKELIYRRHWSTKKEAAIAIDTWIGNWYNRHRRHSKIGYLSPAEYELRRQFDEAA
jgi:putative transposase